MGEAGQIDDYVFIWFELAIWRLLSGLQVCVHA
jgi:hypothetical protein